MIYATEIVQNYRQALQHLWNVNLWGTEQYRDEEMLVRFERLKSHLFHLLVRSRLNPDLDFTDVIFGKEFRAVPRFDRTDNSIPSLLIGSAQAPGGYPFTDGPFKKGDVSLFTTDLFDWQVRGWRDFRFFAAIIDECPGKPSLAGCPVLVDVYDVDLVFVPDQVIGLANV